MSRFLAMPFILLLSSLGSVDPAQDESWLGERVMVVRDGVQFRAQGQEPSPAPLGTILQVSRVNGTWLGAKGQTGWLQQSDVVRSDEAIEYFSSRIGQRPTADLYHHRGIAHVALGQFEDGVRDFGESIRLDPRNSAAYNDRGNALLRLGRLDEALADFNLVIERGVRHPAAYTNRGLAWHEKGDDARALEDFNAALSLDAEFAPAWEAGGAAREALGDFPKAIADYRRAIALDPVFDRALNNLAWILATHPDEELRDAKEAVKHATRATELTNFSDAGYLDTLAAALAAAGQYDDAVRRAQAALEKAPANERKAIQERLALYKAGRPYRDKPSQPKR